MTVTMSGEQVRAAYAAEEAEAAVAEVAEAREAVATGAYAAAMDTRSAFVGVRISHELAAALSERARRENKSMSAVVRDMITTGLAENSVPVMTVAQVEAIVERLRPAPPNSE